MGVNCSMQRTMLRRVQISKTKSANKVKTLYRGWPVNGQPAQRGLQRGRPVRGRTTSMHRGSPDRAAPKRKWTIVFSRYLAGFFTGFKKNSCYVPVLSSLPESSCNIWFQNSYLSCCFKYIFAVLSSPVLNSCTLFNRTYIAVFIFCRQQFTLILKVLTFRELNSFRRQDVSLGI